MSVKPIKAHVRLEGAGCLSNSNYRRVIAVSKTPCTGVVHPQINGKVYYETWRISRECKGFIFREVTHGGGICGHHPSVRKLIIATILGLSGGNIQIAVELDSPKGGAL